MAYTFNIAGSNRSSDVLNNTIVITDEINDQVNTLSFELIDRSGSGLPELEDEVVITKDGNILFGGTIVSVTLKKMKLGEVGAAIKCTDYTRLLDSRLVAQSYEDMTDKEIIEDIVSRYCSGLGITTTNVVEGVTINQISFNYIQPSQCLRKISELTGRNWYIDYDKDIHYFASTTNASPFNIVDELEDSNFINESMTSAPSGTLSGNATYNSVGDYVLLTPASGTQSGRLEYLVTAPASFTAEFDFYTGGGSGADAVYLYFGCSSTPASEDDACGGYVIAYDEFSDQIQLKFNGSNLTSVAQASIDNSTLRLAKVVVSGLNIKIYLDGVLKIDYTDIARTLPGIKFGLGARTGGLTNEHRIYRFLCYEADAILSESSEEYTQLTINKDASQVKNRIYVRGGTYLSDFFTYEEKGDGEKRSFVLPDKPHDITFQINGVTKTLGIKNVNTSGYDAYLNFQEKYVELDPLISTPGTGDTLSFIYKYDIPILIAVEDTASIIEFGSKEFAIFDKSISTVQAARDRANAELTDYGNEVIEGGFQTTVDGFKSGQYTLINSASYEVNANYVVQRVTCRGRGNGEFVYQIGLASAKTLGIIKFLVELLEANKNLIELNDDEVIDELFTGLDSLNADSLYDTLVIDSQGPYFTWAPDSLSVVQTVLRWNLGSWM